MNTSRTSQFSFSRGSQVPRSSSRTRLPVSASAWARVPPPAPVPMMITSYWPLVAMRGSSSDDGSWRDHRAGGAAGLVVGQTKQELMDALLGDHLGGQVLHDEQAVSDIQRLGDQEGPLGVFGRHCSVAPRIRPGEADPALHEPVGDSHADAGLAGVEGVVVVPE